MKYNKNDKAYLWDMLEACISINEFLMEKKFKDFDSEKLLRSAVERQLLILGEAANRISKELQESTPKVPWRGIIGQRNILAHEYGDILNERIWRVAKELIPDLTKVLKNLLDKLN